MAIKAGDLFVNLGVEITDFADGLAKVMDQSKAMAEKLQDVGKNLSLAITTPLAGIAGFGLKAFAGFEQAMNRVAALGDITGASFTMLEKQAEDLGAKTQFSAKQAAEGMGEMAAAGFKANEIFDSMAGVLALAATDHMKLGDAAKIASGILRGFGIEASGMANVADILAKTAADSAVSVTDLGYSFQYIGPVAKALKISFTEVSAALGVLGNQAIRGETAGTALRSMFKDLIDPTNVQAAGILDKLGVKVKDLQQGKLALGEVIKRLAPLTNDLSAAFQIFGARTSDVLALVGDGGKAFQEFLAGLDPSKVVGAAEKMRATMNKGLGGVWEEFTSATEGVAIQIGKLLAPIAEKILKFGQDLANKLRDLLVWFNKLPEGVQNTAIAVAALAAAAGPAAYALGTMMKVFGELKPLAEGLGYLGTKMTELPGLFSKFGEAVKGIDVGDALKSTFGTLQGFSESLFKTIKEVPTHLSAFKTKVVDTFTAVATGISAAASAVATHAKSIGEGLSKFGSYAVDKGISGMFDDASKAAVGFGTTLMNLIPAAISAVQAGLVALNATLTVGTAGAWALVVVAVVAVGTAINALVQDFDRVVDVLKAVGRDFERFGAWIMGIIKDTFGERTASIVAAVWNGIMSGLKAAWNVLMNFFDYTLLQGLKMAQQVAYKMGATETATSLWNWMKEVQERIDGTVKNAGAVKALGNTALASYQNVKQATQEVERLINAANAYASKAGNDLVIQGQGMSQGSRQAAAQGLIAQQNELVAAYNRVQAASKAGTIHAADAIKIESELTQTKKRLQVVIDQLVPSHDRATAATTSFATAQSHTRKAVDLTTESIKKIRDDLDGTANTYEQFSKKYASSSASVDKQIESWKEHIRDIRLEYDTAGKTIPPTVEKHIAQLQGVIDQYGKWNKALKLEKIREDTEKIGDSIARIGTNIKDLKAPEGFNLDPLKERMEKFNEGWSKLSKNAKEFFGMEIGDYADRAFGKPGEAADQYAIRLANARKTMQELQDLRAKGLVSDREISEASIKLSQIEFEARIGGIDKLRDNLNLLGMDGEKVAKRIMGDPNDVRQQLALVEEAYRKIREANVLTSTESTELFINMEKKKLEILRKSAASMTIAGDGFFKWYNANTLSMAQGFKVAAIDMVTTFQKNFAEGFQNVVTGLFSGDTSKMMQGIRALGNSFSVAFLDALNPLKKMSNDFVTNLSKEFSGFVSKTLFGDLLGGFSKVSANVPILGNAITGTLQNVQQAASTTALNMGSMYTEMNKAAAAGVNAARSASMATTSLNTSAESMKNVGASMQQASNTVSSASSNAASGFSKFAGGLNMITGAISAIMDVLQYFQVRRMEKDLGRIEVTTREMKAEIMNLRKDEWDRFNSGGFLVNIVEALNRFGDAHGGYLSEILGTLQSIKADGVQTTTSGGSTPVVQNVTQQVTNVTQQVVQQAANTAQQLTTAASTLSGSIQNMGTVATNSTEEAGDRLNRAADSISDGVGEVSSAAAQVPKVASLDDVVTVLNKMAASLDLISGKLEASGSKLERVAGVYGGTIEDAGDVFTGAIGGVGKKITDAMRKTDQQIRQEQVDAMGKGSRWSGPYVLPEDQRIPRNSAPNYSADDAVLKQLADIANLSFNDAVIMAHDRAARTGKYYIDAAKDLIAEIQRSTNQATRSMRMVGSSFQATGTEVASGLGEVGDTVTDTAQRTAGALYDAGQVVSAGIMSFSAQVEKAAASANPSVTPNTGGTYTNSKQGVALNASTSELQAFLSSLQSNPQSMGYAMVDEINAIISMVSSELARRSAGNNSAGVMNGQTLAEYTQAQRTLTLQVNVNNADAGKVANTMVTTWRAAGVPI